MERPRMKSLGLLLGLSLAAAAATTGCAMLGGDEPKDGDSVSAIPRKYDAVTMRNGDVLTGNLAFETVSLKTPYMPAMELKKDAIDTIEFIQDKDQARVRTKSGDVLRGTVDLDTVRLEDAGLPQTPVLRRADVKLIRCK